jgi:hypothetical protein
MPEGIFLCIVILVVVIIIIFIGEDKFSDMDQQHS